MFAFLLLSKVFSNPAAGFCLKPGVFLPLPAGESRGEGENYRKQLQLILNHSRKKSHPAPFRREALEAVRSASENADAR